MVMISARVVHLSHCGVGRKSLVCEQIPVFVYVDSLQCAVGDVWYSKW